MIFLKLKLFILNVGWNRQLKQSARWAHPQIGNPPIRRVTRIVVEQGCSLIPEVFFVHPCRGGEMGTVHMVRPS